MWRIGSPGASLSASALRPERCPFASSAPVQPEVDVVAVGDCVPGVPVAPLPAPVADRVAPHPLRPAPPRMAVPDDLLDAHPACERVRIAEPVGREQQEDQPLGLAAVARVVVVQVPVECASLGVQAVVVLAELLAAHDAPGRAAGIAVEPGLELNRARGRPLPAALCV